MYPPTTRRLAVPMPPLNPCATIPVPPPTLPSATAPPRVQQTVTPSESKAPDKASGGFWSKLKAKFGKDGAPSK